MTDVTRTKIATKMRGNANANHRGDRRSYYNGIRMDSSWEVKVARHLDERGIQWNYGKVVFPIDEKRSYRPDFILEDGLVIEVKGYWRPDNKAKFDQWRTLYPHIVAEVWDKPKLKSLSLL